MRKKITILVLAATAAALAAAAGSVAQSNVTLTIYSGRSEVFVKPLVERFTKETGIKAQVRYGDSAAIAATILEEGTNSPADVFFSQEAGALGAVAYKGLLRQLPKATLAKVGTRFKSASGFWVGTSARARVIAYSTEKVARNEIPKSIFDVTRPRWKGKVALPPTNASFQGFLTVMRLVHGESRTRDWLLALKANDVRFYPSNFSILQAIARGDVELGLVNHYYLYQLRAQDPNAKVANAFLGEGDPGAFVNAAGVGILKTTKKGAAAQRFVDFLLSHWAQRQIARGPGNAEYPLVRGVRPRPGLPKLGEIAGPQVNLGRLGRELGKTLELLVEVGYTR